jgi:hypothetical protein
MRILSLYLGVVFIYVYVFSNNVWSLFCETERHAPEAWLNISGREGHRYTIVVVFVYSDKCIHLFNQTELVLIRILPVTNVWHVCESE